MDLILGAKRLGEFEVQGKKFRGIRPGIKDRWNARLVVGAEWSEHDLPINPNVAACPVRTIVSWRDARRIHRKRVEAGDKDYHVAAHVHFYMDDDKFDGDRCGIWANPEGFLEIVKHFDGILGVDFSAQVDFPGPVFDFQVYRMRTVEYYASANGVDTVQNLRWGDPSTWVLCFDTLHSHAPLSVGTVASGLKRIENRPLFEAGIREVVRELSPEPLIVVGSARYPIFEEVRKAGIEIVQFDGATASAFAKGGCRNE